MRRQMFAGCVNRVPPSRPMCSHGVSGDGPAYDPARGHALRRARECADQPTEAYLQSDMNVLMEKIAEVNGKVEKLAGASSEAMIMFRDESDKFAAVTRVAMVEAEQKMATWPTT